MNRTQPDGSGHTAGSRPIRRRSRERGAFAMMVAICLVVIATILGVIDIGNLFFERRDLQRIADMSALAGVQRMDDACSQPTLTAKSSASANGLNTGKGDTIAVVCGRWDTRVNAAPSYFSSTAGLQQLNAVQVTAGRTVPYFFIGPSRYVSAVSTARATGIDVFSVGATLVQLGGTSCAGTPASSTANSGLVNAVLGGLLGASSGLNLSLVSYQALACTNVKVGDLVAAAGVGTVDQLLKLNLSLPQVLQLTVNALQQTSVANANLQASLTALRAIVAANANSGTVKLGAQSGTGLLNVALANTQSAADATVDVLDLVMVAAEIANGKTAIKVNLPIALGSLLASNLQVQMISPPSIAIGEGGIDPSTGKWRTTASTAAAAVYLNVQITTTTLPVLSWLIPVTISLPLYINVASGTAWLNATQCAQTQAASTVTITAQPSIANICVGTPPMKNGLIDLSSGYSCSTPGQIVSGSLLGLTGLVTLTATISNLSVQVQNAPQQHVFSGVPGLDANYWTANTNALGSALSNLTAQLGSATITPSLALIGIPIPLVSSVVASITSTVLGLLSPALGPLLSSLDVVLVPLLNLLGVQVGAATVHQISLTCGVAQTVY